MSKEVPEVTNTETQLPDLYACHRCQRIGPWGTAFAHETATGHVSERVSDELAQGVRETWAREGRSLIDGDECGMPEPLKLPGSRPNAWFVVRRSRKIPGGYRVVKYGLTEDIARRCAAEYKTPHEAMSEARLLEIRMAALEARRA